MESTIPNDELDERTQTDLIRQEAIAQLDDGRRGLMEAARLADLAGSARVHLHVMAAVTSLDDAKAALAEVTV